MSKNLTKKSYDIEKYRKQKRRKKRLRMFFWSLLLIAVLVGIIFLIRVISENNSLSDGEENTFPINLKGETPEDLNAAEDGLVVTTGSSVSFYAATAERKMTVVHGYSKPVTKAQGKYFITYDQGGYGIRLDHGTSSGGKSLKLQNQILFAEVNSDGMVAVATQSQRYTSEVNIYDETLSTPIFSYYMNELVMAFSFTDTNECVIAAQSAEDGSFLTILYGLNFTKDAEIFRSEVKSSLVTSLKKKSNGMLSLVCYEGLITLDKNGENPQENDFESTLLYVENTTEGETVIALTNTADPNKTDILVYGVDGKLKSSEKISGIVRDLTISGNKIAVADQKQVYAFDTSLNELDTYDHLGEYQHVAILDGAVYAMSSDRLEQLE